MDAGRIFELRLFDETAIAFSVSMDQEKTGFTHIASHGTAPLPLGLADSDEGLSRWLEARAIPCNRTYADRLCLQMGMDPADTFKIIEASHGLSLNDSYWVVPEGFPGTFDGWNLFENSFSQDLAIAAFAGTLDRHHLGSHELTPELTCGGSLPKAWRIDSAGRRLLWKGQTSGFVPGEALSESAASAIAEAAGLRHTAYWLDSWAGRTCSVCGCFCTRDISYVPFAVATGKTSLPDVVATALCLSAGTFEEVADMFLLDCICFNTDRHLTNFGFLYEPCTGSVIGLAPLFDNGRALFPNAGDEEIGAISSVSKLSRPAFGAESFDILAARLVGDRQKAWIAKLGSTDLEDVLLNAGMGEARAAALSSLISERCRELIELPSVPRDRLAELSFEHFPDAQEFAERYGRLLRKGSSR